MLDFRTSSGSESKRSLWNAELLVLGRDGWWWEKQWGSWWWAVGASKHCLIWSQHHVSHIRGGHRDLSQGLVTGQCLPDAQKIQSHVDTLARLWKLNNHPQALGLHCRACVSSVSWAGCAGIAPQHSEQAVGTLLSWAWFVWGPRPALLCDPQLWGGLLGCSRLCLL